MMANTKIDNWLERAFCRTALVAAVLVLVMLASHVAVWTIQVWASLF